MDNGSVVTGNEAKIEIDNEAQQKIVQSFMEDVLYNVKDLKQLQIETKNGTTFVHAEKINYIAANITYYS